MEVRKHRYGIGMGWGARHVWRWILPLLAGQTPSGPGGDVTGESAPQKPG